MPTTGVFLPLPSAAGRPPPAFRRGAGSGPAVPGGPVPRCRDRGARRRAARGLRHRRTRGRRRNPLFTLTARTSLRTGSCAALGVATADGLHALPAALGGSALAGLLRPVLGPLRRASALGPAALALAGAVTALRRYRRHRLAARADPPAPGPARAYLALLGRALLNPITLIYFAAAALGSRAAHAVPPAGQAVSVLAAFAADGGALLGRALTGHRGRLVTALVSSCVITAPAVRVPVSPG